MVIQPPKCYCSDGYQTGMTGLATFFTPIRMRPDRDEVESLKRENEMLRELLVKSLVPQKYRRNVFAGRRKEID